MQLHALHQSYRASWPQQQLRKHRSPRLGALRPSLATICTSCYASQARHLTTVSTPAALAPQHSEASATPTPNSHAPSLVARHDGVGQQQQQQLRHRQQQDKGPWWSCRPLAAAIATCLVLTSPGVPQAAADLASTASTPAVPTAAAAAVLAAVPATTVGPATPQAAAPAVRFTGVEALSSLPPLPTEFPPLREVKLPNYTTFTLRNGLRVFLLVDDEVPLVRASMLMRGGQYASPPDKVGLASLTAYVQRAGGSTATPGPALDAQLEALAAAVEVGAGPQALSADLSCLREDLPEVMALYAQVVRSPAMPTDKLELYRAQILNALDHQNDSPSSIARRKILKLLYGSDSPYARTPTKDMVAAITVADLRDFAATWERPDAAVLGVVGSFDPTQVRALIEEHFGDWAPAPGQPAQPPRAPRGRPPALPPRSGPAPGLLPPGEDGTAAVGDGVDSTGEDAAPPRRPLVYLVDRPGLTQATVAAAEPGIALSDPDVFALDSLDSVFNSFGGQLFDTLRSKEGLAYSVSGGWDSPPDHPGLFLAGGQTSLPGDFLRSLRSLLSAAAASPPSAAELSAAKAETLNSFAFNFSSTSSQLQRILVYDLLGLPQDYLFRYKKGIEGVTREDVGAAAARWLHPQRQAVVVVGDRELVQGNLEAAGFEVVPMRLED